MDRDTNSGRRDDDGTPRTPDGSATASRADDRRRRALDRRSRGHTRTLTRARADATRGSTEVLGTVMGVLLLAGLLVLAQTLAVPVWNGDVEHAHARALESGVDAVDEAAVRAAAAGTVATVELPVGTDYPQRGPFVNPGPVAGAVRTTAPAPLVLEGVRAVDGGAARYWDGTTRTYDTQLLVASADYNYVRDATETIHEGSTTYTRHVAADPADDHYDVDRFAVVSGDRVSLVTLNGSVDVAGHAAAAIDVVPVSTGGTPLGVTGVDAATPVVVKVPTRLPVAAWEDALGAEVGPGGSVLGVAREAVPDRSDVHYAVVTLRPGRTYELDLDLVGIDARPQARLPAYAVAVAGDESSVLAGRERIVAVEVRDAYNNPVPGATVRAGSPAFAAAGATVEGRTTGTARATTGPDGRAAFVYAAPPNGSLTGHGLEAFDLVVRPPVHDTATTQSLTVPIAICVFDLDSDAGGCDVRTSVAGISGGPTPDPGPDADPDPGADPESEDGPSAVHDPGFAYEDRDGDEIYEPGNGDVRVPNETIAGGVFDATPNGKSLVVPRSVAPVVAPVVDFRGRGVSIYTDVTGTRQGGVRLTGTDRHVRAIGVDLTATKNQAPIEISSPAGANVSGSTLTADGEVTVDGGAYLDADGASMESTKDGIPGTIALSSSSGDLTAVDASLLARSPVTVTAGGSVTLDGARTGSTKDGTPGTLTVAAGGAVSAVDARFDAVSDVSIAGGTVDVERAVIRSTKDGAAVLIESDGRLEAAWVTVETEGPVTFLADGRVDLSHATVIADKRGVAIAVETAGDVDVSDATLHTGGTNPGPGNDAIVDTASSSTIRYGGLAVVDRDDTLANPGGAQLVA